MRKNKIRNLVLGSEGFVGKELCRFLEEKGEEVAHFDIKRSAKEDCRKAKLSLNKFDRVYFLAWEVGGAKYLYKENTQLHQLNWNVELLRNIMPQLQKYKIPFLFTSSQLAEEIDTVYGATKRLGEMWTRYLGGACVRLWNIYGVPEKITERSHVAGDFVHQALTTGKIRMMSTGEEKRQFLHLKDLCEGLHHIMENNYNDAIYDLTSFEWTSVKHLADIISKQTGAKIIPGEQKGLKRTITAMHGAPPGWFPKISMTEGVKMMIEKEIMLYKNKNRHVKKNKKIYC